jgi:hypothetical protein
MTKQYMWVLAIATVIALPVAAQPARVRMHPALALARICISEAGWECATSGDGLAIHEVLLGGADRHSVPYVQFASMYSSRVMGVRPHVESRVWVADLREDCREPQGWPRYVTRTAPDGRVLVQRHPSWARYRARCQDVMVWAREAVSTKALESVREWSPCETPVHDWGGRIDRARAERLGLIEVNCGETRNDFYARPSLVREVN